MIKAKYQDFLIQDWQTREERTFLISQYTHYFRSCLLPNSLEPLIN